MTHLSQPPSNMNSIGEVCNSLRTDSLTIFVGNHLATGRLRLNSTSVKGGIISEALFACNMANDTYGWLSGEELLPRLVPQKTLVKYGAHTTNFSRSVYSVSCTQCTLCPVLSVVCVLYSVYSFLQTGANSLFSSNLLSNTLYPCSKLFYILTFPKV